MRNILKKIVLFAFSAFLCITLVSCGYKVPEGYITVHHTHDEALAFAQSIDPAAEVSRNHKDTSIKKWERNFREWNATINGIECHVASVGVIVWNDSLPGVDLAKQFYVIDTDYDYCLLSKIISEKCPEWEMRHSDIDERYNVNGILGINTSAIDSDRLSDEELLSIWEMAREVSEEFSSENVRKIPYYYFSVPEIATRGNDDEEYIIMSTVFVKDLSDEAREAFFKFYSESWDIMDSGLPFEE